MQLSDVGPARRQALTIVRSAGHSRRLLEAQVLHIRQQVKHVRDSALSEQLAGIDIDTLRQFGTRLRLAPLRNAGISNVQALLRVPPNRLREYPGLGSSSVDGLVFAARKIRSELESVYRLRLDPDKRRAGDSAVLAAVHELEVLESRAEIFEAAVGQLPDEVLYLTGWAGGLVIRVARILPRQWRDRVFHHAIALMSAVMSPEVEAALELLATGSADTIDRDQLWLNFEREAARLYTTLERIGALPRTREQRGPWSDGDLPPPSGGSRTDAPVAPLTDQTRSRDLLPSNPVTGHLPEQLATAIEASELNPVGLSVGLRGYQVFGAKYVLVRRRVLLGDEMGLGKTIMALAVIAHLMQEGAQRFLVVGPNNVLSNWEHEIANRTWFDGFVLHGDERWRNLREWRNSGGIGITTFDTLRSLPLDADPALDLLVVDEAHYVKNSATRRTQAVGRLLPSTERVLFMSGTPMENRLSEFQTLCRMLQPELQLDLPRFASSETAVAFRQAAAPVYLRRNQVDVLQELPERVDVDEWVSFTEDDHARYRAIAAEGGGFIPLRHAAYPRPGDTGASAKLHRLGELVEAAKEDGRKVAIYSEYLHVIDAAMRVAAEECGLPVFGPIRGGVSPAERLRIVKELTDHAGSAVIVAQIQAGAVGLNIQAANVVILCEPALKPSTEEQAIARSYRMGQTRSVRVHRLLTNEGIDPVVQQMLDRKTAEFDEYVRPSALSASSEAARDSAVTATLKDFALREAERLQASGTGAPASSP